MRLHANQVRALLIVRNSKHLHHSIVRGSNARAAKPSPLYINKRLRARLLNKYLTQNWMATFGAYLQLYTNITMGNRAELVSPWQHEFNITVLGCYIASHALLLQNTEQTNTQQPGTSPNQMETQQPSTPYSTFRLYWIVYFYYLLCTLCPRHFAFPTPHSCYSYNFAFRTSCRWCLQAKPLDQAYKVRTYIVPCYNFIDVCLIDIP